MKRESVKTAAWMLAMVLWGMVLQGQTYYNYSSDSLVLPAAALGEEMTCRLHLPETFASAAPTTRYPVVVIFDSQHEKTYPHLVNSIDMLTSESQMPECIVVGIPYNRSNRYYFTSGKRKDGDSLSGIERMAMFLFQELVPALQERFQANDHLILAGHSRTGFLVNYLVARHPAEVDVAIATSGFYDNEPLGLEGMKTFLAGPEPFPRPLKYYFTAGTSQEEQTYRLQCSDIAAHLKRIGTIPHLQWTYVEQPHANHMSNYWLSVPPLLVDAFFEYNVILNTWFAGKSQDPKLLDPAGEFQKDLEAASEKLGFQANPSLTQIFSLANVYAQEENYPAALKLVDMGLRYYPRYGELLEFRAELAEMLEGKGN